MFWPYTSTIINSTAFSTAGGTTPSVNDAADTPTDGVGTGVPVVVGDPDGDAPMDNDGDDVAVAIAELLTVGVGEACHCGPPSGAGSATPMALVATLSTESAGSTESWIVRDALVSPGDVTVTVRADGGC